MTRDPCGPSVLCTPLWRQSATLLIVAGVLVCGTRPAHAQVSMSVMPIRAELAVQPGEMETQLIQVVAQEMFDDPESPGTRKLRLRLRNPGVMHYRVNGESRIVDATGSVLQQLRVPDTVVLPRSERDIIVELERAVSHPYFTIVSQLDVGLPDLLEVETRIGAPPIP